MSKKEFGVPGFLNHCFDIPRGQVQANCPILNHTSNTHTEPSEPNGHGVCCWSSNPKPMNAKDLSTTEQCPCSLGILFCTDGPTLMVI